MSMAKSVIPSISLAVDVRDPSTKKTFLEGALSAVGDPDKGCNL